MRHHFAARLARAASGAIVAVAALCMTSAFAQDLPADLEALPPVSSHYDPPRTAWGDWDFSATYHVEYHHIIRIQFQRPLPYGNRHWQTEEEFQRRVATAELGDYNQNNLDGGGESGRQLSLAEWLRTSPYARRTSMLVSPADGQLPPLTPHAKALQEAGRSGWVPGQAFDWVTDFDAFDRCISRGFPASMYPHRYNNGIRVFQAPGAIVLRIEMFGTRVIPIVSREQAQAWPWPGQVETWLGRSVAWWEGKTLVIETRNIKSGDAASANAFERNASPLHSGTKGVPAFNTIPTSAQARAIERLTRTGPNSLTHELTYSDPEVFTAPWTTRNEWIRDDGYQFFEYACHEGNRALRDYISASRAKRRDQAAGLGDPDDLEAEWARFLAGEQRHMDPAVAAPASAGAATAGSSR